VIERLKELIEMLRCESRDEDDEFYERRFRMYAEKLESAIRPQWISVDERLPELYTLVHVVSDGKVHKARRFKEAPLWSGVAANYDKVTHWMPIELPEPPEVV
jgi:hypothetical protein